MPRIVKVLDGWTRVSLVLAWTAVLMLVAGVAVLFHRTADCWIARWLWAPLLFKIFRSRVEVDGEVLDPDRNYVFVMNHQSSLDIPAAFLAIRRPFRFIAKRDLLWYPFLGFYLWRTGCVLVDRENPERAYASLARAAPRLRAGLNLLAFPEGTRTRDGNVRAFKRGAFVLAQAAGVPIVPVAINGAAFVTPRRRLSYRPGTVRLRLGEAIDTRGYGADRENTDRLREEARRRVVELYREIGGSGEWAGGEHGAAPQPLGARVHG